MMFLPSAPRRPVAAGTAAMLVIGALATLLPSGCGTTENSHAAVATNPAERADTAPILPAKITFNEHIQPILAENCFSCHGPDSSTRKAKLRLDRAEFATAPHGEYDPAIVPGQPAKSPLVARILSNDSEERMPPPDSHKQLKPVEIALLQRWVADGAAYEQHWSLLAPVRPSVPETSSRNRKILAGESSAPEPKSYDFGYNPIDRFIRARLEKEGLRPSREEEPARLLRRVTLDLTGLPPTPAEIAEFTRDPSPEAYARAVDRLLATDACAEQSARHWLDAVRYADTHGIHIDDYRSIWPYRDWVVGAFRRNLPFNQFTIEQMAGDLLPAATLDQKVASGFNRCLPTTSEGGAIAAEYEAIYAKDRVDTMSTVWLGLTTGCAACHDHKFDPITTRDFYSLTAFFRNNTMPAMDGNYADTEPNLFVPAAADRARWGALQEEIAGVKSALQARATAAAADYTAWLAAVSHLAATPSDYSVRWRAPLDDEAGPVRISGAPGSATSLPASEPLRVSGPFGPAPRINGLDLVLDAPVPLTNEAQLSFGLWVRVDGQPSGSLLGCRGVGESDPGWELFLEDGKPGIFLSEENDGLSGRGIARQALAPGKWHYLLVVCDGPASRNRIFDVYVDGKDGASLGEPRNFRGELRPLAPLRLGSRQGADGHAAVPLKGGDVWVQDIRRYDRAFTLPQAAVFGEMVAAQNEFEKRSGAQTKALREYFFGSVDAPSLQLSAQLDRLAAEESALRRRGGVTLIMQEKKDSEAFAHVLIRGEYTQPGDQVPATTPAVLPPLPADAPRDRLALARWLVAPENPLTARVTVNRLWQDVFGTGLVESVGDFGVTGARPSHPQLLDWLAVEFRESGWDQRRLLRLLVTSATYRQSAAITPELWERDPANRLLARGPRLRLDAEVLRDQALAVSGLLVPKLGGRPVRPYQPDGVWEDVAMKNSTTRFYQQERGENLYRRSLYTLWKRTAPAPAMDILNAPSREVSCVRRDRTNTPLQALVTLNEPLFVEASRELAARALRTAPALDARLDVVSLRLLGRTFTSPERAVLRRTLDNALATYGRDLAAVRELLTVGSSTADPTLPAPELAAWTLVASQVMNLDESLTK